MKQPQNKHDEANREINDHTCSNENMLYLWLYMTTRRGVRFVPSKTTFKTHIRSMQDHRRRHD